MRIDLGNFNNLLGIIVGYAQCAQADLPEDSPIREDLAEVVAAGLRGASLTRRLLTFASRENVQPVVHQPGDVVRDMGKMLGRLISEDISLSFFVESDAGAVFADPGQIEQVLMNLVVNARDAMPQGGRLTVETADAMLDEAALAVAKVDDPAGLAIGVEGGEEPHGLAHGDGPVQTDPLGEFHCGVECRTGIRQQVRQAEGSGTPTSKAVEIEILKSQGAQ